MSCRPVVQAAVQLALVTLAGCSAQAATKAQPSPAPAVATVTVTRGTIQPSLQIAGVIAPFRQIGVAADLNEPIADVDVQEGDRVRAGHVLARLVTDDLEAQLVSAQRVVSEDVARFNQTQFQVGAVNAQDRSAVNSARAALHQAQVNLAGAQVDLKRYQSLESQGYLPAQTVDEQATTVASDQSAVQSATAALNQATANAAADGRGTNAGELQQELEASREAADAAEATVEQLRRQIARAVITAPVDGDVVSVNANPGEYPSGRQLFTIEEKADVYAVLPSSTAQAVQIQNGAAATVIANGTSRHDRGTVVAVLDQVQPGTTNFIVKALVHNADDHLRAGMPVTANVDLPNVSGIKIPVTAFVDDTHGSVYVVRNDVVHTQRVSEVQNDGTYAIITGIAPQTKIIKDVENASVADGDHIRTS